MDRKNVCLLLIIVLFFTGCISAARIKNIARLPAIIPKSNRSKPVMLKKVVVTLPRGKVFGSVQYGLLCIPKAELFWRGGRLSISNEEFQEVLRDELERNGYTVVGDPDALFEDKSKWKAEYLIGARINDISANVCYPSAGFGSYAKSKGEAYINVEWQIYSKRTRDVVLKFESEGSSKIKSAIPMGDRETLYQAFAVAVNNMLANDKFYKLAALEKEVPKEKEEEEFKKLTVNYVKIDEIKDISKKTIIERMRKAVVTVFPGEIGVHGAEAHGSGFVISKNGYALTNEHVVEESRFVQVKFVTGREVTAEVIRTHKARDIALLKLEKDIYPYLPLGSSSKISIGDEVYAIGTPRRTELSQTVTKGIVSSFRVEDDLRYIQSDVNIRPGNSGGPLANKDQGVVGISVLGYLGRRGEFAGLNYFIPIEEAIKLLKITNK